MISVVAQKKINGKSIENSGYEFGAVKNGDGNGSIYPVVCNNSIVLTDKGMMILQNRLDSQKDVPGSHSEACASSSLSGVQALKIKVEELSDVEDGEDPVPMTVVGIKTEYEVSFMSLCPLVGIYCLHAELPVPFTCTSVTQNFSSLRNR
jgi:hypothetical protein